MLSHSPLSKYIYLRILCVYTLCLYSLSHTHTHTHIISSVAQNLSWFFTYHNKTSAYGWVSPHELYFGKKLNLRYLRVIGSINFMHVPKVKWRKLDVKSEKCILVSYSDEQKGYKCYHPWTKQVRVSHNIVFNESVSWYFPSSTNPDNSIPISEERSARPKCLYKKKKKLELFKRVQSHFG